MLDDSLALQLAGTEGISLRDRLRTEVRDDDLLAFSRWVCVRSRYAEDIVQQRAGTGAGQYVILGAGLDTFAYRRPNPGLRVFEVDHPATQAWKQRRLADLGVAIPGNLVFVPVDFERQGLGPALEEAGFTFAEPAVFSWLGVTMYLTPDAIGQTLSTIARGAAGTRVVLTYNQPDRVLDDHAVRVTSAMRSIAAGFGEPFVTLFTRAEIDALLREHGFDQMEHIGRDQARARYFGGRQDVEIAGAQALVSAMVRSPSAELDTGPSRKDRGMAEAVTERVRRYILNGSDEDLSRLLGIAEISAEMARAAFRRVGVQPGWTAIDCGCGPIGGLAVMAEMVGPGGRIVGVDFNPAAVQRARAVVSALELGNVEVVAGDLHELDPAALGGPFDLAYSRLFLMHQADPVRTLRRIAGLLRPGGWLVAQEALRIPTPRSHPHLEALTGYWNLIYELLDRAGVPSGTVEDLPQSALEAGFDVAGMSGCFQTADPELFELHASTLAAARERATHMGIAADRIDDLIRDIRSAKDGGYEWVSTPFYLELTLHKPMVA